ncbi:lysine histidine transporter 1-like [Populus alba x Populus x berolinensis]|uniref:Lysine histidine transporter 1-like n=1 Tax=Populus alba x Populus x berolinensis TaxID=444605 RepID=A0AAD6W4Z9_9ROSI|nr:lysine histidine transporter 1-like [Populus alba x Populus x berolinensis]
MSSPYNAKKDLNGLLPITKSRNAKWWYSAFHNVTAMVGAGVLGLLMLCLNLDGKGPGAAVLIMSNSVMVYITLYTLW